MELKDETQAETDSTQAKFRVFQIVLDFLVVVFLVVLYLSQMIQGAEIAQLRKELRMLE